MPELCAAVPSLDGMCEFTEAEDFSRCRPACASNDDCPGGMMCDTDHDFCG